MHLASETLQQVLPEETVAVAFEFHGMCEGELGEKGYDQWSRKNAPFQAGMPTCHGVREDRHDMEHYL
jgi:hypothetical protein